MTRRALLTAALAGASAVLTAHSPYRQWYVYRQRRLIVVVDGTDGAAVRLGERLVRVLGAHLPESRPMVATARSGLDAVRLLRSGQLDIALLPADAAFGALTGSREQGGRPVPLRTLAVLAPSVLHLAARREARIEGVPGLAGSVVGVAAPGGRRTEAMLRRLLAAYGLDPERDARLERLPPAGAAAALEAGRVGAVACLDTLPAGTITDLAVDPRLAIRLLDHGEAAARIAAVHGPVCRRVTIPGGTYSGIAAPVDAVAVPNLLVCRAAVPDGEAHDVAAALGGGRPLAGAPLPPHPGVVEHGPAESP